MVLDGYLIVARDRRLTVLSPDNTNFIIISFIIIIAQNNILSTYRICLRSLPGYGRVFHVV